MVQNDDDTIETFDSVKTGNLIEHDKHYKLHVCCNSCTYIVFLTASAKERSKPVKHASFVNQLSSVPPVENVHNIAQNLPVGDVCKTSGKHCHPRVPAQE